MDSNTNRQNKILFYSILFVCIWMSVGWILDWVSNALILASKNSMQLKNRCSSIISTIIFAFFALNIRQKKKLLFPILFAIIVYIIEAIFPNIFTIDIVTMFGQTYIPIISILLNILIPCAMVLFYFAFIRHPTSYVRIGAIFAIVSCIFDIAQKLSYFLFFINANVGEQFTGALAYFSILDYLFRMIFWVALAKEIYVDTKNV